MIDSQPSTPARSRTSIEQPAQRRVRKLGRSFYRRPAEELARELIGKILVRRVGETEMRSRIVETEAYVGQHDLACHASKGRTARTEIMFGPAGFAYVYLIYGMHDMLNIVSGGVDDAQAVLIRAAEPLDGLCLDLSGPGKLTRALQIIRADNGLDMTGDVLFLTEGNVSPPRLLCTPRIGVDYAAEWKDAPLRFFDADSRAVSKGGSASRLLFSGPACVAWTAPALEERSTPRKRGR